MRCAHLLITVPLLAGCAPTAPHWVAERGAVYCYRTIADPDCHRQPEAGAERRLIAAAPQVFFTLAPAASAAE